MMQERAGTGRIYIQNVDHCNTHSPFDPSVAPVRQSNLCLEIALPTKPLNDVNDENGEIALCTLSAFNLGAIESLDELEELGRCWPCARSMPCSIIRTTRLKPANRHHEPSHAGYWRDQLRLLPGEKRRTLLRWLRAGPDPPHL
jgi:ribonucleotide reductase alpha subunit